jgi:hypothetical protein
MMKVNFGTRAVEVAVTTGEFRFWRGGGQEPWRQGKGKWLG